MKNLFPLSKKAIVGPTLFLFLLLLFACSSNEDEQEPDHTAPTLAFSIAGIPDNTSSPIVLSKHLEINIDAKDSGGIQKVEAFINEVKVGEDTEAPYKITVDLDSYASKGASSSKYTDYTLKIVVTDLAGNTTEKTQVFNVDNELPSISNVSISNGTILHGDLNTITFEVSDNEGVSSVRAKLNGNPYKTFNSEPYTFSIDSQSLEDGPNTLTLEAEDAGGNNATHTVSFIVDNTGPDILFKNLENNKIVDSTLVLEPSIIDAYSGVVQVTISIGDLEGNKKEFGKGAPVKMTFDPYSESTGQKQVHLIAKDSLGNQSEVNMDIDIYRRLTMVTLPNDYFEHQIVRFYAFASKMDGSLLDVKRLTPDSNKLILRTLEEITPDTEFMLTLAAYKSNSTANHTMLTTLQNLTPTTLPNLQVKARPPITGYDEKIFDMTGFDPFDEYDMKSSAYGYYGANYAWDANGNGIPNKFTFQQLVPSEGLTYDRHPDKMYIALTNNTLNKDAYAIVDWDLPSDFVLDASLFTNEGLENKTYTISQDQDSKLQIEGFLNEVDFEHGVYNTTYDHGYGYLPDNGVPYSINHAMYKNVYRFHSQYYFAQGVGTPPDIFQPLDWTVDYTNQGKDVILTKNASGDIVGNIMLGTESPVAVNGVSISYAWNFVFDSQKTTDIKLPEIPEEMQDFGFFNLYNNNDYTIAQVEIKRYDGIVSYPEYLEKVIEENRYLPTVSPLMESVFKNTTPSYHGDPEFFNWDGERVR